MAFVVEDGTGKPDANSYASVEFAMEYFGLRGVDKWTDADTDDQKKWLVQATDYIELRQESMVGEPLTEEQALHFPIEAGVMPAALLKAACEYALRAMEGPLAPDPKVDANGLVRVETKRKIGPLEKAFSVVGGETATPPTFRSYPAADALLAQVLRGGQRKVIR